MSRFLREEVIMVVPPASMAEISAKAEQVLGVLAPEMLEDPGPLDVPALVDTGLQRYNIHVASATAEELLDCEAATDPSGEPDSEINILVRDDQFDLIFDEGPWAHRVRSTVPHELGHAVLHVPVVRRHRQRFGNCDGRLRRAQRQQIQAYCDPEWQAWAFAGCLVAPVRTINMMRGKSVAQMARQYRISESMMHAHLRRVERLLWR